MKDEESPPNLFAEPVMLLESEGGWQNQGHKVARNLGHSSEPIMFLREGLAPVLHQDLKELQSRAKKKKLNIKLLFFFYLIKAYLL